MFRAGHVGREERCVGCILYHINLLVVIIFCRKREFELYRLVKRNGNVTRVIKGETFSINGVIYYDICS